MRISTKPIIYDSESYINSEENLIVPFAQADVTDTFISGINNDFIVFLKYYIYNYNDTYSNEIIKFLIKKGYTDIKTIEKQLEDIKKINEKNAEEFIKVIKNYKEINGDHVSKGVKDISTDDLVNIAENMIKSTSIKRKLDSDLNSVGGDIDIIIITRNGLNYESKTDCNKQKCCQNKEKS